MKKKAKKKKNTVTSIPGFSFIFLKKKIFLKGSIRIFNYE